MAVNADIRPCEAPLTHDDVPEQDGSEDPGVGLAFIRDAVIDEPRSPSALEHVNIRSGAGLAVPGQGARQPRGENEETEETEKTQTVGVGEGATVSHAPESNRETK